MSNKCKEQDENYLFLCKSTHKMRRESNAGHEDYQDLFSLPSKQTNKQKKNHTQHDKLNVMPHDKMPRTADVNQIISDIYCNIILMLTQQPK